MGRIKLPVLMTGVILLGIIVTIVVTSMPTVEDLNSVSDPTDLILQGIWRAEDDSDSTTVHVFENGVSYTIGSVNGRVFVLDQSLYSLTDSCLFIDREPDCFRGKHRYLIKIRYGKKFNEGIDTNVFEIHNLNDSVLTLGAVGRGGFTVLMRERVTEL